MIIILITRLVDSINNRRSHAVALYAHVMEIFEFCRWLKFEARWSIHFVTILSYRHSHRVLTYNFHLWDRTNFHTKPWWSSDQRVIFYWDVHWFKTTRGFTAIFGILFKRTWTFTRGNFDHEARAESRLKLDADTIKNIKKEVVQLWVDMLSENGGWQKIPGSPTLSQDGQ